MSCSAASWSSLRGRSRPRTTRDDRTCGTIHPPEQRRPAVHLIDHGGVVLADHLVLVQLSTASKSASAASTSRCAAAYTTICSGSAMASSGQVHPPSSSPPHKRHRSAAPQPFIRPRVPPHGQGPTAPAYQPNVPAARASWKRRAQRMTDAAGSPREPCSLCVLRCTTRPGRAAVRRVKVRRERGDERRETSSAAVHHAPAPPQPQQLRRKHGLRTTTDGRLQ